MTMHPPLSELSNYLENVNSCDQYDVVGIHIEKCVQCQQTLTELLCGSTDILDVLRDDSQHDGKKPSWLTERSEQTPPVPNRFRLPIDPIENLETHSNRYQLIEEVARGGMGVVYRAVDKELDREVAVKVISDDNVDVNRFEREAKISGQLQHPGVVPIHDYGVLQNGEPFISMKLVEGQTLREILDAGSVSHVRLIEIFTQVCQTVAYSHSQSIVHRDLKPSNIMIGSYGEVQVMDWGLAKKVDSAHDDSSFSNDHQSQGLTETKKIVVSNDTETRVSKQHFPTTPDQTMIGTVVGTPAYMPYEQAIGKQVGLQADVFSLGAMLCEFLTGQPPFTSAKKDQRKSIAGRFENENNQLGQAIQRIESCEADPALIEIAKSCLARDAANRPNDAAVVSDRLTEFAETRAQRMQEIELERASSVARLQVETKRRKQVFRLGAVIATVLTAAAVATTLFLIERNTRQAEQFAAEKTAIEKRASTESRIRSIMSETQTQLQQAVVAVDKEKTLAWKNASFEIKRAFDIVDQPDSSTIDERLLGDLSKLKHDIQNGLARSQSEEARLKKERQMATAIHQAIKQSVYPNDLMFTGIDPNVTASLEKAFANYGLAFESNINESAVQIRNSSIAETLISGLRLWRNQHRITNRGKSSLNLEWFKDLLNAADEDGFRAEVRELTFARDISQVKRIVNDPLALKSVATVHTVFDYLNATRQRNAIAEFMKRAHYAYPGDFEINHALRSFYKHFYPRKPELALRHSLACLAIQPDNPGILINLTMLYISIGDNEAAIEVGDRMIELVPNYPQGYNNVAIALSNLGRNEEAVGYYERAIEAAPEFHISHGNLAVALGLLGRDHEAVKSMKRAIELKPQHVKHYVVLGKLLLKIGEAEQAEQAIRHALKLEPKNLEGLQIIVKILRDRGNFDEAIAFHKQQIKFHKYKTDVWANYAETLFAAKRYDEAEDLIDGPFRKHFQPRYADVLARAQMAQGKVQQAIETLELQIEKRPNSTDARKLLKKYQKENGF